MRSRLLAATVVLSVSLSMILPPQATLAGGFGGHGGVSHGGGMRSGGFHGGFAGRPAGVHGGFVGRPTGLGVHGGFGGRPGVTQHGFGHSHVFVPHHGFGHQHFRGFAHQPFFFGAVVAPFPFVGFETVPSVVVEQPPFAVSALPDAVYSAQPNVAYAPPPAETSPAQSTTDTVIQYSHGRYELRGDGVSTPYVWVWIPNPPPPPPAPPAPAGPPSSRPTPGPSSGHTPASLALPNAYRWIDDDGVTHWTNNWDSVPDQYRSQMKRPSS
jgi:hypothetical protein